MIPKSYRLASAGLGYTAFFNTDESRIGQMVEFGPTVKIFTEASSPQTRDYVERRFG